MVDIKPSRRSCEAKLRRERFGLFAGSLLKNDFTTEYSHPHLSFSNCRGALARGFDGKKVPVQQDEVGIFSHFQRTDGLLPARRLIRSHRVAIHGLGDADGLFGMPSGRRHPFRSLPVDRVMPNNGLGSATGASLPSASRAPLSSNDRKA